MVAIPENGDLEQTPLPHLLMGMHRAQFCGRLELEHDRCQKAVLFDRGAPIFAESNLASESLGVQLMDAGRITRLDYSKIVSLVEKKQCKEGNALLELGFLEPRELFLALREQVRVRLLECFGWPRGLFSIDPNEEPPADAHPFRAELYSLVQEGIETHWSSDRVIGALEPKLNRYPVPTRRFAAIRTRLRSDAAVVALLARLDGSTTLWRALQAASTPRSMAAAWLLDAGEAFEYSDEPEGSEATAVPIELELVSSDVEDPSQELEVSPTADLQQEVACELQREIVEKFSRLDESNHYELLGVDPSAEAAEIRGAYLRAAKTYHPDALARAQLDETIRNQAGKVFAAIGKAHAVLSKPAHRREYDAAMRSDGSEIDAEQLANAETLFRKGEVLLRQGNFKVALEFLAPAVEQWPNEADYRSALGWALYKMMPSDTQSAKEHLEAARELRPDDPVVIFRLSVVLRALGDKSTAKTLLERARQLDPRLT
ncbi:MAG: DnaJ domain-containing protein [Myxococcota bacterium]